MDTQPRVRNFWITALVATIVVSSYSFFSYGGASAGQMQSVFYKLSAALGSGRENPKILSIQRDGKGSLEDVLATAATADKTVILTTLNGAWAANDTMIDLYLQSFHRGEKIKYLLDHMVIVALDQKAHDRCLQLHPHCLRLNTSGVDFTGEKRFMTGDYLKMMWRRIQFLGDVLELGYSFIFSDADILWFRDPFARFSNKLDFQIACDWYDEHQPFNVSRNSPNGGFVYVRSNRRTVAMYKYWHEARLRNPGKHDQDVLNIILREEPFGRIGVRIRFLDTIFFSGFCESTRRDITKVVTMHANCCIGLRAKLKDLQLTLDDWSLYKKYASADRLHRENKEDPRRQPFRAPLACVPP